MGIVGRNQGGRRLNVRLGRRRRVGFRLEDNANQGTIELTKRFVNDSGIVFGQPVPKMRVWDLNGHSVTGIENKAGRAEPGIVAMLVNLRLNFR